MKPMASLAITLVLVLALSSCLTPMQSRRGPAPVRKRHVVQKRLTAEDVLGDMYTQQSGVLSESHCLDDSPAWGSCKEIYDNDLKTSGYYRIYPGGYGEADSTVFCDMSTLSSAIRPGGGWTVILRRLDSSLPSFNRTWQEYRNGFGCLNDSFWLGLQKIKNIVNHKLPGCSKTVHQLYVGLERYHPNTPEYKSAFYNVFSIGDESTNYALNIDIVSGVSSYDTSLSNAGDALGAHSGLQFSAYDQDNDISSGHCAETGGGGWWYRNCIDSHLTGMFYSNGYMPSPAYDGIIWEGFSLEQESLNRAVMATRPVCNDL